MLKQFAVSGCFGPNRYTIQFNNIAMIANNDCMQMTRNKVRLYNF